MKKLPLLMATVVTLAGLHLTACAEEKAPKPAEATEEAAAKPSADAAQASAPAENAEKKADGEAATAPAEAKDGEKAAEGGGEPDCN